MNWNKLLTPFLILSLSQSTAKSIKQTNKYLVQSTQTIIITSYAACYESIAQSLLPKADHGIVNEHPFHTWSTRLFTSLYYLLQIHQKNDESSLSECKNYHVHLECSND